MKASRTEIQVPGRFDIECEYDSSLRLAIFFESILEETAPSLSKHGGSPHIRHDDPIQEENQTYLRVEKAFSNDARFRLDI